MSIVIPDATASSAWTRPGRSRFLTEDWRHKLPMMLEDARETEQVMTSRVWKNVNLLLPLFSSLSPFLQSSSSSLFFCPCVCCPAGFSLANITLIFLSLSLSLLVLKKKENKKQNKKILLCVSVCACEHYDFFIYIPSSPKLSSSNHYALVIIF
ncbi:Uncharacterized protein APZ42_003049 [Daphnia magna]|uniref:Uncharacterized protein n=1 Tax=Daphnia magna TaxID=35525 RepID=A0A164HV92_9CRUS|nr:Uncharacterized protein APZ42_003049 [Daphnia magna]